MSTKCCWGDTSPYALGGKQAGATTGPRFENDRKRQRRHIRPKQAKQLSMSGYSQMTNLKSQILVRKNLTCYALTCVTIGVRFRFIVFVLRGATRTFLQRKTSESFVENETAQQNQSPFVNADDLLLEDRLAFLPDQGDYRGVQNASFPGLLLKEDLANFNALSRKIAFDVGFRVF